MLQWERRLRDLSQALRNCGETYFNPDLFRQNINHFLQTSRTVTFIIQKNKATIPEYESWYSKRVIAPWKKDTVMTWAKDARNFIEKEGDLEMHSYLAVSVVFSYLAEEDFIVDVPRPFLLQGDINKIAKLAKEELPPGVLDAAVLQIERRWVTKSLSEHELIAAITIIYSSLYKVCEDLATHLGSKIDPSIPHPTQLDPVSNDVARTRFIKLGKPNITRMVAFDVQHDPNYKPPESLLALRDELKKMKTPESLEDLVTQAEMKAIHTFSEFGNHVPMLFLFDENWNVIDFSTTAFSDQADKFLFWRNAGKRAAYLRASSFVWVAEAWIRKADRTGTLPIKDMPIIGEQLQIVAGNLNGEVRSVDWNIIRNADTEKPLLERVGDPNEITEDRIFFIRPLLESMRLVKAKEKKPAEARAKDD